jgi:general secretion pathway protein L
LPSLRSVSLLFDARDVTLLRVKLPPLSGAKLRQAVPNAVEDLLLQDAQQCAFALGPVVAGGQRLIAVIDRAWLEFVVGAFERRGIKVLAAWPTQLALPLESGALSIECVNDGIALRADALDGSGWYAGEAQDERTEALVSLLEPLLKPSANGLGALAHDGALTGQATGTAFSRVIAGCEDPSWHEPLRAVASRLGIAIDRRALAVPLAAPVDLLAGRPGTRAARFLSDVDWRAWRLPAALAGACAIIGLMGLNLHWGMLARERDTLRSAIERTYRQTFPDAQVIVDPVLQMERQVAVLRARAGQSGPEDFLPLLARFSQALGDQAADALAGVEYREGRLRVRFQPGRMEARELRDALARACQRLGLALSFDAEREPTATVALAR